MQVLCCFWNISVYLCLSFHKEKKRITQAGFLLDQKLDESEFISWTLIFRSWELFSILIVVNMKYWRVKISTHFLIFKSENTGSGIMIMNDNPSVQSPVCWCFCSCMVTEYLECWYILGCSNLGSNYAAYIYSVQLSFLWVFWKYRSKIMHTCRNSLTDSTCRDLIETITVIGTLQGLIWCRLTWMLDYQRL